MNYIVQGKKAKEGGESKEKESEEEEDEAASEGESK